MDYFKYFLIGYRTAEMDPFVISLISTVRLAIILLIGFLVEGLAGQFKNGDFTMNLTTVMGYIGPGVVILLQLISKWAREATNGFVTTTAQAKQVSSPQQ